MLLWSPTVRNDSQVSVNVDTSAGYWLIDLRSVPESGVIRCVLLFRVLWGTLAGTPWMQC